MGDLDPHLIHGSLGLAESSAQTAPFLQGSFSVTDRQTDRRTDRPTNHTTRSVTIGRIYVRIVLRCGLKAAESMELPFGMLSWVDPRNHVLDRGPDSPWEGTILREE